MQPVESLLAHRIGAAVPGVLGGPWDGDVPVEVSNRPDLGDYASPVAFALAKAARRPPMDVAGDLAEALAASPDDVIGQVLATAPGFLNIRLADAFIATVVQHAYEEMGAIADSDVGAGSKIVIEHTNINPNKAAHVGHFRNACLGDSLARILGRLGYMVEVQNYIDDTGTQVADVVVGLRYLDLPPHGHRPFDRYCSDVYVAVQKAYEADPGLAERRKEVQRAIETGEGELATYAREVTSQVAAANLATMARAGVTYDLLTWESDILALGFWEHAFGRLRQADAIRFEESGPNAGCWVLPFGAGSVETDDKTISEDKVLVTSRGIATYTAKDIAYQLWKFGLLGLDFCYRRWGEQMDGRTLWTAARSEGDPDAPAFAGAELVVNVIDATQSYLQRIVYDSLRRLGYDDAADHSEHLAYERVTLAASAARELGANVPAGASDIAMTGRGGIQVLADDLLDSLAERIAERTTAPGAAPAIAAGAARYYMLKFSNNQKILFDFDEALRTTGETGVYLQYAHVRSSGIARRLDEADLAPAPLPRPLPLLDRALVLKLTEYPGALHAAGSNRSVLTLAKYAFDLATAFNAFYDNTTPVVQETDQALRAWRAGLVGAFRLVMGDVLDALGIPIVDQI